MQENEMTDDILNNEDISINTVYFLLNGVKEGGHMKFGTRNTLLICPRVHSVVVFRRVKVS